MGSRPSARRALISLVLVAALAGCGDADGEPTPSSTAPVTVTPTPSPEPSPTPSPLVTSVPLPVMPPEMANNDAAGAEAAARYFVALISYSYANRDVERFVAMTDDECVFCAGVIEEIERMNAEGVKRVGGMLRVVGVRANDDYPSTASRIVTLEIAEDVSQFLDPRGGVLSEAGERRHYVDFVLTVKEGSWVLVASGESE